MDIHQACMCGTVYQVLDVLTPANIGINNQDLNGDTPLHIAIMRGNYDMVSLLLQHGADTNIANINGDLPVVIAQRILLECRAEIICLSKRLATENSKMFNYSRELSVKIFNYTNSMKVSSLDNNTEYFDKTILQTLTDYKVIIGYLQNEINILTGKLGIYEKIYDYVKEETI